MRKYNLLLLAMMTCLLPSCKQETPKTAEPQGKAKIGPKEMQLQSDVMTPEVLWSMGRIGEYSISPDKSQIVYTVT